MSDLASAVGGTGRAKSIWEEMRKGVEPLSLESAISLPTRKALEASISQEEKRFVPVTTEKVSVAKDGTTKLLVRLNDGLQIETVLIPHRILDRTTLCVSTQVGCDRGCSFCATGTLGLSRNLTANEIAAQFFCALNYLREAAPGAYPSTKPLSNVVMMGMGDAGVNYENAAQAAVILTDQTKFNLAKSKCTISTVGPSPQSFMELAAAPCMLAWSLHSPDDALRRLLVPTHTTYSAAELRQGLIDALLTRPAARTRTLMVAATLISGINDSDEDARRLALFIQPLVDVCVKLNVDLIPVNKVAHAPQFQRPSDERLKQFADTVKLYEPRVHVALRVTRGDDENAACGQLIVADSHSRLHRRRNRNLSPSSSSSSSSSSTSKAGGGGVALPAPSSS